MLTTVAQIITVTHRHLQALSCMENRTPNPDYFLSDICTDKFPSLHFPRCQLSVSASWSACYFVPPTMFLTCYRQVCVMVITSIACGLFLLSLCLFIVFYLCIFFRCYHYLVNKVYKKIKFTHLRLQLLQIIPKIQCFAYLM